MAKKKKSISLHEKKITFTQKNDRYTLLLYAPSTMTVDALLEQNGVKCGVITLPFAHLPKEIKKLLNPL